jgi:hypothetical protein
LGAKGVKPEKPSNWAQPVSRENPVLPLCADLYKGDSASK